MTARRVNVDDFEQAARARLEPGAFGYFAGGAPSVLGATAAELSNWAKAR